jgi:2-dehydro-3-deoxyphosphogluconate aldolase/(4S)-4-hydroxy-2-oxoglutarate aldolase
MESDVLDQISRLRIVPVIEIPDPSCAAPLGAALLAGGLPCAEVTFRTASAAESISRLREACPGVLVGAGTVLSRAQVDAALDAGASFMVAPGLNLRVVEYAMARGATMIPGVCTPTEIEAAMSLGLSTLKFFPAEIAGGAAFLRAVAAVYPAVRFIPTGGIGPTNLADYLDLPSVLACGGSWMVKKELIAGRQFEQIERMVRDAVELGRARNVGNGPTGRPT